MCNCLYFKLFFRHHIIPFSLCLSRTDLESRHRTFRPRSGRSPVALPAGGEMREDAGGALYIVDLDSVVGLAVVLPSW